MSSDDHQKKKGGGRKRSARRRARNAADREDPPGPLITLPQDLRANLDMDGDNAVSISKVFFINHKIANEQEAT